MDIRTLTTLDDFTRAVTLEIDTWGDASRADAVSVPVLVATVECGAILLGAFEGDALVGFSYAFLGTRRGVRIYWSHTTCVHRDHRDRGIGRRLKLAQRERVLAAGIDGIEWTFDPLQSANAAFNFSVLGVVAEEYRENFYGMSPSLLHGPVPTDRLIARWNLTSAHVARRIATVGLPAPRTVDLARVPVINPTREHGEWRVCDPNAEADLTQPRLLLEVPGRFAQMLVDAPATAGDWRHLTRRVFQTCFTHGYRAVDFFVDRHSGRGQYLLTSIR